MLKGKNLSGIRLSLRYVKFLPLLHWYPFKWLWQAQELQLTADCLGRARESVLVTAVTSCSTTWVILRLFELGVCAPRRGKASSSGALLQCKPCQAQLLCPCPKHCWQSLDPMASQLRELVGTEKIHFQVNLHHFQLPEITHHCCCMSASARSR